MLHLVVTPSGFFYSGTFSKFFFVFYDFDVFEEYNVLLFLINYSSFWGFSEVSLSLDPRYMFLARNLRRRSWVLLMQAHLEALTALVFIGDVNFDFPFKVLSDFPTI